MNLEFKVYKLKEDSKMFKRLKDGPNEFIVVGEEKLNGDKPLDCFKVHQVQDGGIALIGGLNIDEFSLLIEKKDLELSGDGVGYNTCVMDIPKKYLTLDIVENIQRLNSEQ